MLVLLGTACRSIETRHGAPLTVRSGAEARAVLGSVVVVRGVAQNAKLSAAIVAGDAVVYWIDRESWPGDLLGQEVSVRGRLVETSDYAARTDAAAAVTQGTAGSDLVLKDASLEP